MSVIRKCGYCLQVHPMGSECPKPEAPSSLAQAPGSLNCIYCGQTNTDSQAKTDSGETNHYHAKCLPVHTQ